MSSKKVERPKKKKISFVVESEAGKTVSVAGTFNNWSTSHKVLVDKNDEGIYRGSMLLAPGTYEYKFYIDETWCIDPANPNFSPNDMGTLNSLLVVEDQ